MIEKKAGILERWGLATHIKYNVNPKEVYHPDEYYRGGSYSVTTRPGVHVLEGDVESNGSNDSPLKKVYFERLQVTNKGKAVAAGLCLIATSLVAYFVK